MAPVKTPAVESPEAVVKSAKAQPQHEPAVTQVAATVPAPGSTKLLDYTHSRLVAVFDSRAEIQAATRDLTVAGFGAAVEVHCGAGDARGIDFRGTEQGPMARVSHALHTLTAEGAHMEHYERELLAGNCIVIVVTKSDDEASNALRIVEAHGGRFINQFGFWAVETVHP